MASPWSTGARWTSRPSALTIVRQRARGIKLLAFRSFGFGGAEPVQMSAYLFNCALWDLFACFLTLRVTGQGPPVMLPAGGPAPDNMRKPAILDVLDLPAFARPSPLHPAAHRTFTPLIHFSANSYKLVSVRDALVFVRVCHG